MCRYAFEDLGDCGGGVADFDEPGPEAKPELTELSLASLGFEDRGADRVSFTGSFREVLRSSLCNSPLTKEYLAGFRFIRRFVDSSMSRSDSSKSSVLLARGEVTESYRPCDELVGFEFWFLSPFHPSCRGTDLGTFELVGVMTSGERKYSAELRALGTLVGLEYAYGLGSLLVKRAGSSISVFRCGILPRSAKLFLRPSLAELNDLPASGTNTKRLSSFSLLFGCSTSTRIGS